MTKEEFKDLIENGRDIMFDVSGKHYTILTWWDDGILIAEQNTENHKGVFSNEADLLDNYHIDGIPLGKLSEQIVITQYA